MSKNCIITTVKSKIKGNATSYIERENEIFIPVSNKFSLKQTRAIAIDKVNKINKEYLSEKFGDVVSLNTSYTDGTGINIHPSKRLIDAYEVKEGNKTLKEVNSGRDLNYFNGDVALYEQEQRDFENEANLMRFSELRQELRVQEGKVNFKNNIINGFDILSENSVIDKEISQQQAKTIFNKKDKTIQDKKDLSIYFANYFLNSVYDKEGLLHLGYTRFSRYGITPPKLLIVKDNGRKNPFFQYNNVVIIGLKQLEKFINSLKTPSFEKFENLINTVAQEEIIHLYADYLLDYQDIDNIYNEMTEKDINQIKKIYGNASIQKENIVHEYVRMVVQQRVFGRTTEYETFTLSNAIMSFFENLLEELNDFLNRIIGSTNTQKAIEDVINFTKGNFSKELDEKIINRVFDKGQILEANLNVLNNFQEEQKELDKIVTKINNESRQLDLFESFQNIITNENKPTPIDTTKSAGLLWGKMSSYESETNFQPTESKSQYRSDNSLQEKINGRSFKEIWNSNEFTQLERENILLHSIQKRMLDKNSFNGELFAGINSKLGKLELRVVDNEKYPFLAFQKQIYINPKTFLKYLQNANIEDVDKYLDLTVSEELIHVLTNYFTSLEDIKKIATEINPNNFKYIQSIYKSLPSGDFELGTREYLRMIVQQEILGTTTEKIKYTKNGVIDSIIDKIWNFLYQIFKDNKGTLAENVKKHIDFIKSNNVDSTNNYKSDIFQVETSLSQNIKYQLSKEQSDAIDNVFDENPELDSIGTQQLYSQYLEQNPNGNIEQFKDWVDEFSRNKNNLEQQSENKTIDEIYKEKPYLKEFIDSVTDESNNISIYGVKNTLDKHGEGRIVKLNKILYNAINRLWDNNVFAQNNLKIKFVDSLPENAVGNFNRDNNEITIDKRKFLNNVIDSDRNYPIFYLGYILNHEIIHYLTPKDLSLKIEYVDRALNGGFGDIFRLESEKEFGKNIKELYDVAIEKLDNVEDYGFLNLAEFVAEAMSNPSFQEKLASIPFKTSKQSLWKRFIKILSDYLSLDTKKPITDTLLEAVIAETTNYITENSNIQRTYKRRKSGKTENIDIGYDFVYTTQKNINTLSNFISQKSQERLNQVKDVFNENPELSKIGTVEQYASYLDTIFPNSKVKDIVYHGTDTKFEKFNKLAVNKLRGKSKTEFIHFTTSFDLAMDYSAQALGYADAADMYKKAPEKMDNLMHVIPALINGNRISNENVEYGSKFELEQKGISIENTIFKFGYDLAVFEPEQIHILSSKADIQGFKNFMSFENSEFSKYGTYQQFRDFVTSKSSIEIENRLIETGKIDRVC